MIEENAQNNGYGETLDYQRCRSERTREREARNELHDMKRTASECEGHGDGVDTEDRDAMLKVEESEVLRVQEDVTRNLKGTEMKFTVKALHWRWDAIRYLTDLKQWKEEQNESKLEREEVVIESGGLESVGVDVDEDPDPPVVLAVNDEGR